MHSLHPSFFILRHRKVGPFKISGVMLAPNRTNTAEFVNTFQRIPSISAEAICTSSKIRDLAAYPRPYERL